MKVLKTKKFFLDYVIGSGLIVIVFSVLIGSFTILDTKGIIKLGEECSSSRSPQAILSSAQSVLHKDEQCEIVEPCEKFQRLFCKGTAKVVEIPMHIFAQDLLVFRVKNQLMEKYVVVGYSDKSTFRIPIGLIKFLFFYLAVLVEAGALLFALWRQNLLRETFSFPSGSKTNQILGPLLTGIFLAAIVVALNFQVDRAFEYPNEEQALARIAYFKTIGGIILAILVAPVVEELIFRGVLFRLFIERKREFLGFVITSAAFAFLHVLSEESLGWQMYKFAVYFLVSTVFCWSYMRHKSLWRPIILHGSYNATMVGFVNFFA